MRKLINKINKLFVLFLGSVFCFMSGWSQVIPLGTSKDSLLIQTPPNSSLIEGKYGVHYYKPLTYNSSSPILLFIHGTGGDGTTSADLQTIADRQNALIVAPTMHNGAFGWAYATEVMFNQFTGCYSKLWYTQVMKQIYRHVLSRESRSSINTYLTGFSAGGQFVTRYMLFRQFSPDSIPIKMAVSVNPSNYTLMTDTFNSVAMVFATYRCGLAGTEGFNWGGDCDDIVTLPVKDFICNSHIKQYYNENYGLLCGTADTVNFGTFCPNAQGVDRFDRMKIFHSFSKSNAITRSTTLKWICDSVANIAHDQINMYNKKRNGTDTFTVAERMIFRQTFHSVTQFTPDCFGAIGIDELNPSISGILVYPNPALNTIHISVKDEEVSTGKVEIINSLGQEVYQSKFTKEIDVSTLANGYYFIRISIPNKGLFYSKFIKE